MGFHRLLSAYGRTGMIMFLYLVVEALVLVLQQVSLVENE